MEEEKKQPEADFYKDDVRELGRQLKINKDLLRRFTNKVNK